MRPSCPASPRAAGPSFASPGRVRPARLLPALAALALLGAPASALGLRVWLATAPAPRPGSGLVCRVASESDRPLRVRVQGIAGDGTPTSDSGFFRLEPAAVFQAGAGRGAVHCRITTLSDEARLRAGALLFDRGAETPLWLPARPSRILDPPPRHARRDARSVLGKPPD